MPNITSRGLFARSGAAWKPPANVWARAGGVWKQADYVWAYHNGAWQMIWARVPVPPPNVLLSWIRPATVRIAWSVPTLNPNTSWIVRRSDGSIVATVPSSTYVIDDTRPLLSSADTANKTLTYTVEGSDGNQSSVQRVSDVLTWNLTPAAFTATPSYPNTTATVTLNWTPNATYGDPQGWQAYLDGYGWVGAVLPGSARTTTVTGQGRGTTQTWRIVSMTLNAAGAWIQAGNCNPVAVNLAPNPPTNVQCFASGISQLCGQFNGPVAGSVYDYHVQRWQDGNWIDWFYTTSGGPHCWGTTTGGYFRVTSRAASGVESEWVQAGPAYPVNDVTGPPAVAVTVGAWDVGTATPQNLSWPVHADPSGNSLTQLQASYNGGAWQSLGNYPPGQAYNTTTNPPRGASMQFRLYMVDGIGNATIGPATASVWSRPLGSAVIYPSRSQSYGNVSGWQAGDRCIGGAYGGQENYGFWWYGNQIVVTCKGYAPDRMYFDCQKVNGLSAAGTAYIAITDQADYNGTVPGIGGIFHAPTLGTAESNEQFASSWYPGWAQGQIRGAAVIGNGQPFKALYGKSENGNSGAITLYFDQ